MPGCRNVPGTDGLYSCSSAGIAYSNNYNGSRDVKPLTPTKDSWGYSRIGMNTKEVSLARTIAMTWIREPLPGEQVNHIDGNKDNNDVSNLEWVTCKENIRHAVRTGLRKGPRGALNHKAKLTEDDVRFLRELHGRIQYKDFMRDMAAAYGVDKNTIHSVVTGRTWKCLNS